MDFSTFEKFYDNVISKYLEEIMLIAKKYPYESLKLRKESLIKQRLYRYYQEKRNEIKRFYMDKSVTALDGHKVASCFIYAILKVKPIKVNLYVSDLPENLLLANECLAIYVAINIVDMYRRKLDEKRSITKPFTIKIPLTYSEKEHPDAFIWNTCKSLYYVRNINNFDAFAYATIMFLLEKITDLSMN